jgi:hypothetical protein
MNTPAYHLPLCPICNKAVDIETAKTDDAGRAIHEGCYALSVSLFNATMPPLDPDPKFSRRLKA